MSRTGNLRQCRRLQALAYEYLSAHPGPDTAGPNVALHKNLRSIGRGNFDYSEGKLNSLFNAVTYRLRSMHEANHLRELTAIPAPSIFNVDIILWQQATWIDLTSEERKKREDFRRQT